MKRKTRIFVVTHGDKEIGKFDPELTPEGRKQTALMVEPIGLAIDLAGIDLNEMNIICGTGKRHFDTFHSIFDVNPISMPSVSFNPIVGNADSSDKSDGQIWTGTLKIPKNRYFLPKTISFIESLEESTLIISGRPFMIGLNYPQTVSGALYEINVCDEEISIKELFISTGEVDKIHI